jgi:arylsulfatase A-like enzyme
VQGYNYNAIKKVVQKHRLMLRADPKFYIDSNIVGLPQQAVNSWISKEIKFKRKFIKRIEIVLNKFITLLLPLLSRYRLKNKIYVDSSELANRLVEKIYRYAESDQEQPFYLWTHFMDTHAPYCPGELPNWPKNSKKYLKDVGYVGKYNISEVCDKTPENQRSKEIWNAAYDCCVRYTDEQIGKIISALDETGLRDSTLVVILGDHGEEIGEHGEYGHRFRFYDECVNVPILFNMPNFKEAKISGLSDLTDIAPTILGICGIDIPKTYQGVDLSKPSNQKGKKFIQMEAFHRGNCSFKHKPVYMGIRTETHKYIWREWKDPEDVSSDSSNVELYDLEKDSSELINISEENSDIVDTMQEIVASRLSELTEYCKNRDKDALIKSGVNKYLE